MSLLRIGALYLRMLASLNVRYSSVFINESKARARL